MRRIQSNFELQSPVLRSRNLKTALSMPAAEDAQDQALPPTPLQTVVENAGSSAREDDDDAKAVNEGSEAKEQVREGNGAAAPP